MRLQTEVTSLKKELKELNISKNSNSAYEHKYPFFGSNTKEIDWCFLIMEKASYLTL